MWMGSCQNLECNAIGTLCAASSASFSSTIPSTSPQVQEGQYVVWRAIGSYEAAEVGRFAQIATGLTWAQAKASCDSNPGCLGMSVGTTAGSYRTLVAERFNDYVMSRGGGVTKVRVFGPDLNTWIPDPTA